MSLRHLIANRLMIVVAAVTLFPVTTHASNGIEQAIQAAMSAPERPTADKQRDAQRKPEKVLSLLNVKPGMKVLDINSSEGYYTELLSRFMGEKGTVIAHNDPTYMAFLQTENHQKRFANNRLNNVEHYQPSSDVMDLAANTVDGAILPLAFHDYYYVNEARDNKKADVIAVAHSIYQALKPGARLIVIDHVGQKDGTDKTWHEIHRVAPHVVKETFKAAGFKLKKEYSFLANPDDNHQGSPFDKSIRGNTDRFVHLYVKS